MNRVGQLIGKTAYVPGQGLLRVSNMWIYIIYTYIYIYVYVRVLKRAIYKAVVYHSG